MINDSIIILAAGLSSRMKKSKSNNALSKNLLNQANTVEKGLIGVDKNGKPLIHYLLVNAQQAGFINIFLVIGEKTLNFKNYFSQNKYEGLNINFAIQYIKDRRVKPSGTAGRVFSTCLIHASQPSLKMRFSFKTASNTP